MVAATPNRGTVAGLVVVPDVARPYNPCITSTAHGDGVRDATNGDARVNVPRAI